MSNKRTADRPADGSEARGRGRGRGEFIPASGAYGTGPGQLDPGYPAQPQNLPPRPAPNTGASGRGAGPVARPQSSTTAAAPNVGSSAQAAGQGSSTRSSQGRTNPRNPRTGPGETYTRLTEEAAAAIPTIDGETFGDRATSVNANGPGSPRPEPEPHHGSDDGLTDDMREVWLGVEHEVALAQPVPSVEKVGPLPEMAAGLFLPVFAPAYERAPLPTVDTPRMASPADSLPELVHAIRDRFNTIGVLHNTLISDCRRYTQSALPRETAVPRQQGPGPHRLPPVDRLNWLITAVAVARTRLLAELESVQGGIGQSAGELLAELRSLRTGVVQGGLHSRDPFQSAVLFQKLCYHRDALIALHRLLYLHADGAAKSKLYYRDRVLTDLVDGPLFGPPNHIVPDWPRSADVNRIRSNLNRLFDSWQGQEEGYRAMATVCRTMIEAYDRLMVRAFLGTLSGEYILAWCRIYIASFRRSVEILQELATTIMPAVGEEERRGLVSTFLLA